MARQSKSVSFTHTTYVTWVVQGPRCRRLHLYTASAAVDRQHGGSFSGSYTFPSKVPSLPLTCCWPNCESMVSSANVQRSSGAGRRRLPLVILLSRIVWDEATIAPVSTSIAISGTPVSHMLFDCQPQSVLLSSWETMVMELANQVSCTQLTWPLFKFKFNSGIFVSA